MQLKGYRALSEMSVDYICATKTRQDGKSGSLDELARENLPKKTALVEAPRTGTFTHLIPSTVPLLFWGLSTTQRRKRPKEAKKEGSMGYNAKKKLPLHCKKQT